METPIFFIFIGYIQMHLSKFDISMLSMEKWEKEGICSRES